MEASSSRIPMSRLARVIDMVRWRLPRRKHLRIDGHKRARLLSAPDMVLEGSGTVTARNLGRRSYALDVRHNITVRGLTFIAAPGSNAVHIDHPGAQKVLFEDCTIISPDDNAMGVGVRPGAEYIFRRCTFRSIGPRLNAIYVHSFHPDADIILEDCVIDGTIPGIDRLIDPA